MKLTLILLALFCSLNIQKLYAEPTSMKDYLKANMTAIISITRPTITSVDKVCLKLNGHIIVGNYSLLRFSYSNSTYKGKSVSSNFCLDKNQIKSQTIGKLTQYTAQIEDSEVFWTNNLLDDTDIAIEEAYVNFTVTENGRSKNYTSGKLAYELRPIDPTAKPKNFIEKLLTPHEVYNKTCLSGFLKNELTGSVTLNLTPNDFTLKPCNEVIVPDEKKE